MEHQIIHFDIVQATSTHKVIMYLFFFFFLFGKILFCIPFFSILESSKLILFQKKSTFMKIEGTENKIGN
jgi:hypothetical protein